MAKFTVSPRPDACPPLGSARETARPRSARRGRPDPYRLSEASRRYCPRFGQRAIELGLITVEQLNDALRIQIMDDIAGRPRRLLGSILFEQGRMSAEQIERVLTDTIRSARAPERTEP